MPNLPERWYELLRKRMQVEHLRMHIVKNTAALLKTINCKNLAREEASRLTASVHRAAPRFFSFFLVN
jgi:hypothetical protein